MNVEDILGDNCLFPKTAKNFQDVIELKKEENDPLALQLAYIPLSNGGKKRLLQGN